MTHRANQIVDAMVSIIDTAASPLGIHVYPHRRFSLAGDQDELPAISVDFGEDSPQHELTGGYFDSLLTCMVTAVAEAPEEQDLKLELLDLRRKAHVALMADRKLGLEFVVNTLYAGAEAPQIEAAGETIQGALTSVWQVYYRMNISDPGN
jgi:hypothetical protein